MQNFAGALLAALMLAASGPAALGQDTPEQETPPTFLVEQGHWWITRAGMDSCVAHNRPPQEFNAVPYNSLALQQRVGETQPRLQAIFWPGSFEQGQELQLLIVPSSGKPFEYPARAASDYHVTGLAPLTEAEFDKLAVSTTLTVGGDATPQALVVDAQELDQVELWLDSCAS
jgi:hypothetical protein